MLPSSGAKIKVANGRTNALAMGTSIDVPDHDASILSANGWFDVAGPTSVGSGTTAQRPTTGLTAGLSHYADTTLAYLIVWDGLLWRNPITGASV